MFTKSLKKFFAKSKSESFDRDSSKFSSGLRRFFSLDGATSATTTSAPSTTSLYRQPSRQRFSGNSRLKRNVKLRAAPNCPIANHTIVTDEHDSEEQFFDESSADEEEKFDSAGTTVFILDL